MQRSFCPTADRDAAVVAAAASLVDILRATIVLDDPYALAVCAAYIQKEFAAVRLKNRFASDPVETVTVDRLLSEAG